MMKAISIQISAERMMALTIPLAALKRLSSSASAMAAGGGSDARAWVFPTSTRLALAPYVDMPAPASESVLLAELIHFHCTNRFGFTQNSTQIVVKPLGDATA